MREYGYLEKMLDMLTDPYTHRDLQNVRKNRKLETNIGKLFSLLADGFEVIHKNAELVRLWDDLENAEGAVLDRYGANFGVQRGAASDSATLNSELFDGAGIFVKFHRHILRMPV